MPGLGPTADGLSGDPVDPDAETYLVSLTYIATDMPNHEAAAEAFWEWLNATKDPAVTVSRVPVGSLRSDPQEIGRGW